MKILFKFSTSNLFQGRCVISNGPAIYLAVSNDRILSPSGISVRIFVAMVHFPLMTFNIIYAGARALADTACRSVGLH